MPSLSRSSEVTRSAPVFRLKSRSWKTSWMPSSRSGPSIAMLVVPRARAEDVLEVDRGPGVATRAARELAGGLEVDHPLPAGDGIAEPMLPAEEHPLVVQRADVLRVEAEHAGERRPGVVRASQPQERLAQGEEGI